MKKILIIALIAVMAGLLFAAFYTEDQVWNIIFNDDDYRTKDQVLNAALDTSDDALKIGLVDPAGIESVADNVITFKLTDGKIYDFMTAIDSISIVSDTVGTDSLYFYSGTRSGYIDFN